MQAGEANLTANIKYVFDERLRNAVAHSTYILTDDEFRIREPGPGSSVPLKDVDRKVNYSFRFLSGLLTAASNMKYVCVARRNITNGKITKCSSCSRITMACTVFMCISRMAINPLSCAQKTA